MSRTYVPKALRERVAAQARYRRGYCLTSEMVVGTPMEVDRLLPEADGGLTEEDNLWLACSLCNDHKSDRIAAFDPETESVVRLFDPRHQIWTEHFRWSPEADRILGLTPTGRATVLALHLNRASLVTACRLWAIVGWHPPED